MRLTESNERNKFENQALNKANLKTVNRAFLVPKTKINKPDALQPQMGGLSM